MNKIAIMKIFVRTWVKGAVYSFIFSAIVIAMVFFDFAHDSFFGSVLQFLGTMPVFVAMKLLPDVGEFLLVVIYFIYWIVLGGLIGWGISKEKKGRIGVILLIVVLSFAHYKSNITMQKEIEDAVKAFVDSIPALNLAAPHIE